LAAHWITRAPLDRARDEPDRALRHERHAAADQERGEDRDPEVRGDGEAVRDRRAADDRRHREQRQRQEGRGEEPLRRG
jgi:hypothetical protein